MVNVAINGFGRIGRMILRASLHDKKVKVVAVNDLTDAKTLAHLLKHDSSHGTLKERVSATKSSIKIGKQTIPVYAQKDPANIPWAKHNVDVVLEATGFFRDPVKAAAHLTAGAKKVIITATPKGEKKIPTIVLGVNEKKFNKNKHKIVSNASCTTNNVTPILKVINDSVGVKRCLFNTIHAYTSSQKLQDGPHKDLRRTRAAAVNIIPTSTSADKAAAHAIPSLKGKIRGFAFRVPVLNGSVTEFTIETKKPTTEEFVNNVVKKAAKGAMKGIIEYSEAPLVSSDIIGNSHSAIFDSSLTTVVDKKFLHIVTWYDNEWGYSNRMVDLVKYISK